MTAAATETAAPATASDAAARIAALRAGDRRALAAAVTELEADTVEAPALIQAMLPHLGKALVLGITGPPGAGKSTLVNTLIIEARRRGSRVAVIAVDPTSPVSQGAILGDRIRMTSAQNDDGVYVRSLASAGYVGGLSPAAVRIIDVLDAAGFGLVILETVGTGQNEVDVAEIADVRVVVAAPGLGDDIQAMKSGLLEIADILVVNKGDRPGADQTVHHLKGALSIRAGGAGVPVVKTSAVSGIGVAELLDAIGRAAAREDLADPASRRRRRARFLIARAAADLVKTALADSTSLDGLADEILRGALNPAAAAREILSK